MRFKFPLTKLTVCLSSVLLFAALWSFIAGQGWSNGGGAAPSQAAVPLLPTDLPLPTPTPVVIHRVNVIERVHVINVPVPNDGSAPAPQSGPGNPAPAAPVADIPSPSAPPPSSSAPVPPPAPVAPPPVQPAPTAAPPSQPAPRPQPTPTTVTRAS